MTNLAEKLQATIDAQDRDIAILRRHVEDLEMALERQKNRADANEMLATGFELLAGLRINITYYNSHVLLERGVFKVAENLSNPDNLDCTVRALATGINTISRLVRASSEVKL